MMDCPFCKEQLNIDGPRRAHLVIGRMAPDGHIHIHGDLDDKDSMREMLDVASQEIGIPMVPSGNACERDQVVFHNRQRIGDILVMTCGVRDFAAANPKVRINVSTTARHIWDYAPYIDQSIVPTDANMVKIGPGKLTNASNRLDWHFCNAYRMSIEEAMNMRIPQGESRPDVWLHQSEYESKRPFPDPYWIICITGEKGWGCKMYPFDRWQDFVNSNPGIQFVQIGAKEDNPPRLQGHNVVDWVGQTQSKETGIRDLFKLFLHAEGSIGLVSFHMHLSAGLYKPALVVAGAREPVSFTRYPGHQYLATDGCLPCATQACWHCDIKACTNIVNRDQPTPRCVDVIHPEMLSEALKMFYRGGRLTAGKVSDLPKLKNIARGPVMVPVDPRPMNAEAIPDISRFPGFEWGGGSLTHRDWAFMLDTIQKHQVRRVLEFGAGLSTLLLNEQANLTVLTFETNPQWAAKVKALCPRANIIMWDGHEQSLWDRNISIEMYDLAFVDGPAGGANREHSTKLASMVSKILIIHDANREHERKWQDLYCKNAFQGPIKGGHRCHLWIPQRSCSQDEIDRANRADLKGSRAIEGKLVRVVSTARGWGGCARSVTTIMDYLLKYGHRVEFVPFRESVGSREYQAWLRDHPDVEVRTSYSAIKDPCDVLLVYADDFVWEFSSQAMEEVFSGLQADRKVMVVNYRNGAIGEVSWTKGWDRYVFLNHWQQEELLKRHGGSPEVRVLAPCTVLDPFLKIHPNYDGGIRVVRHSSQGDTKFPKDFDVTVDRILGGRADITMSFLPGPSFLQPSGRVSKFPRTADPEVIAQFLGTGNLFWYMLPEGYMDMGPRVILEAMAAGLPVLADNWGGAVDRVPATCGWLRNSAEEHINRFLVMETSELKHRGEAARQFAIDNFVPERWLDAILKP